MAGVSLRGIGKRFGTVVALDDVSLEVADGELVALLGPSGCGKTTLLRVLAGLETPDAGSIGIGGSDVSALPPERRRVGMMFQSYALFPHMTVAQNLAFPLRMRRVPASEHARRVEHALALVRLEQHGGRYPHQLSGGQQQRVALARALIDEPAVLLLDEPLSNLDAQLREQMQVELIELRAKVRLTTLIVTHDQDEAMSLADRIALLRAGRMEQIGAPRELYESPATPFAADFIGAANLLPVVLEASQTEVWNARLSSGATITVNAPADRRAGERQLVLRMEDLTLSSTPDQCEVALPVRFGATVYRGSHIRQRLHHGAHDLTIEIPKAAFDSTRGATHVAWRRSDARIL